MKSQEDLTKLLTKYAAKKRYSMSARTRDFIAGSAGAAVGTAVFHPLDTIITSMQSGMWSQRKNLESSKYLRTQLKQKNIFGKTRRLYRGVPLKLLKNAPAMGVTLAAYGAVKKYLNKHMNIIKN